MRNSIKYTKVRTGRCVVLQGNDELGSFLESLEEGDDKVTDVLSIGGGERVLIALHCRQGEALAMQLARTDKQSALSSRTTTTTKIIKIILTAYV